MTPTEICDAYAARVYRYMRYRVSAEQDAEDLTSQVFERAIKKLDSFDERRGSFEAWLFGIARNQLRDFYRLAGRRREVPLDAVHGFASHDDLPDQRLIDGERFTRLASALKSLSERELTVVSLRYAAEVKNVDIARVMRLSEKNVGVILCRAMKKLRRELCEEESE